MQPTDTVGDGVVFVGEVARLYAGHTQPGIGMTGDLGTGSMQGLQVDHGAPSPTSPRIRSHSASLRSWPLDSQLATST